jgi:hypothetical protein
MNDGVWKIISEFEESLPTVCVQETGKEEAAYAVQQTALLCLYIATCVEVFMRCTLHVVISIVPTIWKPTYLPTYLPFICLTKWSNVRLVKEVIDKHVSHRSTAFLQIIH